MMSQLGIAPGGEFRAAYKEAKQQRCVFRLGDRAIATTFKRAMGAMSLWDKTKLACTLLFSGQPNITKEHVEEAKNLDYLTKAMNDLESRFKI